MNLQHLQFGKWCYIYPGVGNFWRQLPLTRVYSKHIPFLLSSGLLTTKLLLSPSLPISRTAFLPVLLLPLLLWFCMAPRRDPDSEGRGVSALEALYRICHRLRKASTAEMRWTVSLRTGQICGRPLASAEDIWGADFISGLVLVSLQSCFTLSFPLFQLSYLKYLRNKSGYKSSQS